MKLPPDTSVRNFLRPFETLMNDDDVTEIAVNGPGEVWFEKNSGWSSEPNPAVTMDGIKALGVAVATFSFQVWDAARPLLSASLPDGTRIQLVMPPAVEDGRYSFTLRKPARSIRTLDDYAAQGLFSRIRPAAAALSATETRLQQLLADGQYKEFLELAVRSKLNIVVSGATGSGKTTFMKSLVQQIPARERLITIEDARELFLPHKNTVHLLYSKGGQNSSKVDAKDLLEACLRMKPDRILLAELRGSECLYYIRNAASGHPGSITSCHAGTPALAFEQLAIMIQDSPGGANLTFDVIKRLLTLTIDVVVQFSKTDDGARSISEIYYAPEKKLQAAA